VIPPQAVARLKLDLEKIQILMKEKKDELALIFTAIR
jgi:hypothetical protein